MPATTFIVPRRFAAAVRVRELHLAILDLIRGWTRIGGEREAVAWGEVLRNERYPLVHMANLAWADATPPGGPREILGALERAYLDGVLDVFVVAPWLGLFRRLDALERRFCRVVAGEARRREEEGARGGA